MAFGPASPGSAQAGPDSRGGRDGDSCGAIPGPYAGTVPVQLVSWAQADYEGTAQLAAGAEIATALHRHLLLPDTQRLLDEANQPRSSSATVQAVFLREARELGFSSEARGLFSGYPTAALRPDYYRSLPEHRTGILLEVERGKTTINNMDFLDFWKCHICEVSHHLFLMVPQVLRQNAETQATSKPFKAVSNRLIPFFERPNYTNVRSCWLFGY